MAIRLITDSASDILPEEAQKLGIIHIPLLVNFGGVEYADAITLTHKQFYQKLIESDTLPSTSQASPELFAMAFREIVAAGDTPVAITVSGKLSGTYQSAKLAAQEFEGKAFVIDSNNVCVGERLLVLRAHELIRKGITDVHQLIQVLEVEKERIRVLAILDTLEYLKKGGRISAATAFAGTLLSIKPVVGVVDGEVKMVGKARGSKNGSNLLRTLISEGGGVDFTRPYCVAYSGLNDDMLRKYVEDSADLWQANTHELPVCTVGCVIGTHVGPGAIAVAFFENK